MCDVPSSISILILIWMTPPKNECTAILHLWKSGDITKINHMIQWHYQDKSHDKRVQVEMYLVKTTFNGWNKVGATRKLRWDEMWKHISPWKSLNKIVDHLFCIHIVFAEGFSAWDAQNPLVLKKILEHKSMLKKGVSVFRVFILFWIFWGSFYIFLWKL